MATRSRRRRALGAFGLTEPDAGSDAGATRTRARRDGDNWVIDGTKAFITNSGTPITSVITVTARTDDGISTFVVETGTPGLTIEPPYRKLGWHASDTHGVILDNCSVPDHHLLGAPGSGLRNFLSILDDGRIAISALALGCARACLGAAVAYAKERTAFGGPIGRNQGIAFALADLEVAVENAANLTYKAAWLKDQGRPFTPCRRHRQAVLHRSRGHRHPRRHAGIRRERLHRSEPDRPLLPRREDPRDRRGHQRDPADRHRPRLGLPLS